MHKEILTVPNEFSFDLSLSFLQRSPKELLHHVLEGEARKLLQVGDELVLFSLKEEANGIAIEFLNAKPSPKAIAYVRQYITEWFDLETDLKPFYSIARKDDLLKPLVKKFHGYRIIGQPDLFESLVWAVLGQQINLAFAYTLKQRFVDAYGKKVEWNGHTYHLFPEPAKVAALDPQELLTHQFSRQKSQYTVGIAEAFASGKISKELLKGKSLKDAKEELIRIKGIGNWTANYALMKTYRYPDAFPLEDAGLHNAIRNGMNLRAKPSLDRVKKIFKNYKGWEAYATLYLWKSL